MKKGTHHTEEALKKMSKTWFVKGMHANPAVEFKKGHIPWHKNKKGVMPTPWNKGKHIQVNDALKKWKENGGQPWNKGKVGLYSHSEETKEKISMANKGKHLPLGYRHTKEAKEKIGEANRGEKSRFWKGGISFEPYGIEFNEKLKEQIRKRDQYRCQQCFRHQDELYYKSGKKYKLNCHHVDYDKKNNKPENLISLCKVCHSQTEFNRDDWVIYYGDKMKEL